MPQRRKSLARIANEQVRFGLAASWAGLHVSERGSRADCPECGSEQAFRGYTDHGFCHSCRTRFSAVRLLSVVWQMEPEDAARRALDEIGFVPVDWAGAWQHAQRDPDPDRPALARALRTWCAANIPGWEDLQYERRPAGVLAACLGKLPYVRTEADCAEWLDRCEQVMLRSVGKAT